MHRLQLRPERFCGLSIPRLHGELDLVLQCAFFLPGSLSVGFYLLFCCLKSCLIRRKLLFPIGGAGARCNRVGDRCRRGAIGSRRSRFLGKKIARRKNPSQHRYNHHEPKYSSSYPSRIRFGFHVSALLAPLNFLRLYYMKTIKFQKVSRKFNLFFRSFLTFTAWAGTAAWSSTTRGTSVWTNSRATSTRPTARPTSVRTNSRAISLWTAV